MFELKLILHKELTKSHLDEIIRVKSIAWPFCYTKQIEWIENNLNDLDIHVLLYFNAKAVAYLNVIIIEVAIDEITKRAYGIGNVCSIEKGNGYGKELISKVSEYLIKTGNIGVLFCKNELVNFYKLNNWVVVEKENLSTELNKGEINIMIYNNRSEFHKIDYKGDYF